MLIELVKACVPGTGAFLLVGLAIGAGGLFVRPLLWRRAVVWFGILGVLYLALSLPWTARVLPQVFCCYRPVAAAADALGATAVVTFDGDHVYERIRETSRLYALLRPRFVIVSGEADLRDAILQAGVPRNRLLWEHSSTNTREQALGVRSIAKVYGIERVVLVASPIHMARARRACEAVGLRVVPSVTDAPHLDLPARGVGSLRPRRAALWFSSETVYEYLALAYYWARGWFAGPRESFRMPGVIGLLAGRLNSPKTSATSQSRVRARAESCPKLAQESLTTFSDGPEQACRPQIFAVSLFERSKTPI